MKAKSSCFICLSVCFPLSPWQSRNTRETYVEWTDQWVKWVSRWLPRWSPIPQAWSLVPVPPPREERTTEDKPPWASPHVTHRLLRSICSFLPLRLQAATARFPWHCSGPPTTHFPSPKPELWNQNESTPMPLLQNLSKVRSPEAKVRSPSYPKGKTAANPQ